MSSVSLFLHRLHLEVVFALIQDQPRNLIHIQVRKRAHVVAAVGVPHQI